jgi:hypothetical protein
MILVSRKETGRASDDLKNPTGLLVRKKKGGLLKSMLFS